MIAQVGWQGLDFVGVVVAGCSVHGTEDGEVQAGLTCLRRLPMPKADRFSASLIIVNDACAVHTQTTDRIDDVPGLIV